MSAGAACCLHCNAAGSHRTPFRHTVWHTADDTLLSGMRAGAGPLRMMQSRGKLNV